MVLRLLVTVHLIAALATSRTFFQPDEYWQSLEIAHRIVFGYGYQTWEWMTSKPIRSVVYPAMFVPLYKAMKAMHIDNPFVFTSAPAIQQALITAVGDWFAFHLVTRIAGHRLALVWVRFSTLFFSSKPHFNARSLCILLPCTGFTRPHVHSPILSRQPFAA